MWVQLEPLHQLYREPYQFNALIKLAFDKVCLWDFFNKQETFFKCHIFFKGTASKTSIDLDSLGTSLKVIEFMTEALALG